MFYSNETKSRDKLSALFDLFIENILGFGLFFWEKMANYTKHLKNGTKPIKNGTKHEKSAQNQPKFAQNLVDRSNTTGITNSAPPKLVRYRSLNVKKQWISSNPLLLYCLHLHHNRRIAS
jgi:hypothetical protein